MAYELPENLSDLSDEALGDALDEALTAFRDLGLNEDSDDDTIAEGERIAPAIRAIREEQQGRVAAAESRRSRVNDLLATMPEPPAEAAPVEAPAPQEPVAEAEVVQEAPETDTTSEETVVSDIIPEPVAASAVGSPVDRAAANMPEVVVPRRAAVLTAAADVAGFASGQELDDLTAVGRAWTNRLRALPKRPVGAEVMQRFSVAQIRKPGFGDLVQDTGLDDYSLVQRAADERRLDGASLTAAGGWCAPSETLYDLCQMETTEGLLDLPEINITRGGIRFTEGPNFSDIYSQCGFHQAIFTGTTDSNHTNGHMYNVAANGTLANTDCKDCCKVDCPAWQEVLLEAVGLCVKVDILTNHAYPELVRRHIEGSLVAHQHKVSAIILAKMVADAGSAIAPTLTGNSVSYGLDTLEWQIIAMRQKYRLTRTHTMEVVAPSWLEPLIRMDIARRNGQDWTSVSDADVARHFASINVRVQWVYDWQDADLIKVAAGTPATIPATVNVLVYPAGTWVRGGSDVISLDAVYDSVGLEGNVYTGLFVEEAVLAFQRCSETLLVTLPTCANGMTGAQATACVGAAVTTP